MHNAYVASKRHEVSQEASEAVAKKVFKLLRRVGPLCPSQISVDLLIPIKVVERALEELKKEGLAEQRPDRDKSMPTNGANAAWGIIVLPFGRRRSGSKKPHSP